MDPLIGLLIYIVIVAIVCGILSYVVDVIPVQAPYNRWIKLAILILALLLILRRALPLLA